ncbi:ImmA/IrrE family metallo-endopeptidase [Bifidobacterium primatium]|uniref:ImmA/IrrE family metallo-endopeptidase n=1 Tax=Bifidobacterium primatium TaxID=2045438 RepID=UPI0010544F35|nr:hypothetical protein [Bifidobacterium primatium]
MISPDDGFYTELKQNFVQAAKRLGFYRVLFDPVELMSSCGIHVLPYLGAMDPWDLSNRELVCKCPSGISFTLERDGQPDVRFAAYNNCEPSGRIRFTAAHEAAHCFLGHKEESEVAELQANFWGGFAVAPPVIVHELGMTSPQDIANTFGLSQSCSRNVWKRYLAWQKYRNNDRAIDDSLLELYTESLWLQPAPQAQSQDDVLNMF